MSERVSIEDLEAQIAVREQRFAQVTADIRLVFMDDAPAYVARTAKQAFMAQPDAASSLTKAQVSALKEEAVSLGHSVAEKLGEQLESADVWRHEGALPDNRRDLSTAEAWSHILGVQEAVEGLLGRFSLGAFEATYKAPAYFVNGRFLPALVEHYWRLVEELRALRAQRDEVSKQTTRGELEALWDEA